MVTPVDPTSAAFLVAESRQQPMHVGGLQLFRKPDGAGRTYVRDLYRTMRETERIAPLFLKHPVRSPLLAGQYAWAEDELFDIDHHVRHSALPKPGRVRELLDLTSRLHGTRLARERPLWEAHVIEGLRDGRIALYIKMHHALADGVSAMRLLQSALSSEATDRDTPAPWSDRARASPAGSEEGAGRPGEAGTTSPGALAELPITGLRTAYAMTAEAAGMPAALLRTLYRGARNETSAVSWYAPRTIFNQHITGSRRFAAQDWPVERMQAIRRASGTTLNDVVLAMCSGAVRAYLSELGELPEATLVAMVPVGLNSQHAHTPSAEGGNAVGAVMVKLGTDIPHAHDRLQAIHVSMQQGKQALEEMSPAQILAMTAVGMAPALLVPMLRMQGIVRPPFNLIISNVPGPKHPLYFNGAPLVGTYPMSIPLHGMALNITCTSYNGTMGFGLTGCRRTLPHLQRLLTHLDTELTRLEHQVGA